MAAEIRMQQGQIWLCGDVHGDLRTLHRALAQATARPDALILLGDLDPPEPVGVWLAPIIKLVPNTWFIHGNHETDSDEVFQNMFRSPGAERNLHGRVTEIAGLRVAGLGGVFRGEAWYPPASPDFDNYDALHASWLELVKRKAERPARPRVGASEFEIFNTRMRIHRSTIFPDDYHQLANQSADLLIVHEAPSCHPNGFEAIDLLAQTMGVRWVVHGHHHDALDYRAHRERLGFTPIGVGLRGITTLAGEKIVAGEQDEARGKRRSAAPVEMHTKGKS